jgi:hypothetical protein
LQSSKKTVDIRFVFAYSEGCIFAGSGAGDQKLGGETRNGLQPYGLGALVSFPVAMAPLIQRPNLWLYPADWGLWCVWAAFGRQQLAISQNKPHKLEEIQAANAAEGGCAPF